MNKVTRVSTLLLIISGFFYGSPSLFALNHHQGDSSVSLEKEKVFESGPQTHTDHNAQALENDGHGNEHGQEGFNAGELILHHVQDAHEIHFMTLHAGTPQEHHISIYLPVILWTPKGLDMFSSSRFLDQHHQRAPHTSQKTGYTYGMDHGHIVVLEEAEDGWQPSESIHVTDLSMTKNVIGVLLISLVLLWVFLSAAAGYRKRKGLAPKGIQSLVEPIILFIRDDVAKPSIGHGYEKFMPFLLTVFFFIWIGNMIGLVPFLGGLNVTGNIAVCLVLAAFTFVITSIRANKHYWKHIFAPSGIPLWLLPIIIPIEILGVFSKPGVLMLRLFANITAGHIVVLSFTSIIFIFGQTSVAGGFGVSVGSVIFGVFINCLEILVAFLQAYVFTLLSALYFGMATEEAHH